MKGLKLFAISAACLLLLCGCWDKHELEDNTYAILLGIDAAEGGDIVVTVAFPLTQTEGGGLDEGMDNGSGNYSVMSVKAPTLAAGLKLFDAKLSGPLALYSVKTVVISQEVAESDALRQVFSSWRHEEIRNTTGVLISECKAAEFIKARIKNSPIDPLRQEELLLEQMNANAHYQSIQLLELLTALKSNSGDGIAMYGGVAPEQPQDDKQNENSESANADIKEPVKPGYLPNEIPISAANVSRISGLAVFRGGTMAGILDSQEAQTYAMLTQNGAKTLLTVQDPLAPEHNIAVEMQSDGNRKIHSTLRDGVPVFTMNIRLKCAVESVQSGIDYSAPQNEQILTAHVRDICAARMTSLIAKTQQEYNADILQLGDKLARRFYTVGEWEQYNWPEKYQDAEIHLNLRMEITHTGSMSP